MQKCLYFILQQGNNYHSKEFWQQLNSKACKEFSLKFKLYFLKSKSMHKKSYIINENESSHISTHQNILSYKLRTKNAKNGN